jgi:hypothetical protein
MQNNKTLKDLHMEKMSRQKQSQKETKENVIETPFECPVCYTDGSDSGIVSPKCGHKICVNCYSTIIINTGKKTKCPCCRAKYMVSDDSDNLYEGMPDLVSTHLIYNTNTFVNLGYYTFDYITDLSASMPLHIYADETHATNNEPYLEQQ